ncbi:MAG: type II CAAX endopeptidase family protein [Hyphomicrobiaceae bacterium]
MTLASSDAAATPGQLFRRWLEMLLLFLGLPLAMAAVIYRGHVPLFAALPPVLGLMVILMVADRSFSLRRPLGRGFGLGELALILGMFAVLGGALAAWVYVQEPHRFLSLPRARPRIWMFIMLVYPLVSVVTQEILYRVFYFHRYRLLFERAPWLGILVNAALFSFGHIFFWNWPAMILTFFGGLIFAWRYTRTGSFWAVALEHTLYGNLVFTIGLGSYFFTGVSNF